MPEANAQLALSSGLTAKAHALYLGLESGAAEILDLVDFKIIQHAPLKPCSTPSIWSMRA